MNAEQFEELVKQVLRAALKDRLSQAVEAAHEALDGLSACAGTWIGKQVAKGQAQERLGEAKRVAELARAEVVQEAVLAGEINGKNAEERERQVLLLLDAKARTVGDPYGQAVNALKAAQATLDQAGLEESIASEELSVAKLRCRLVEAQLYALAER